MQISKSQQLVKNKFASRQRLQLLAVTHLYFMRTARACNAAHSSHYIMQIKWQQMYNVARNKYKNE